METQNYDIINKYFDLVQQEIKKLISEDKEIKPSQVEQFNAEIFNQPDEIKFEIRNYIDKASQNNLDIKKVAQEIYDRFKLQVKNNVFNQKDAQNVPNPLLGERKYIKTYEQWTTDVAGDYEVNYGDKPQISDVVIDTIKFIEDNFNDIKEDILNDNKPNRLIFKEGLKYTGISLKKDKEKIPFLEFYVKGGDWPNTETYFYSSDITDDEYEYLKDYFFEVYKKIRKKVHDKQKEDYIKGLEKIEDDRVKKAAKKYNL